MILQIQAIACVAVLLVIYFAPDNVTKLALAVLVFGVAYFALKHYSVPSELQHLPKSERMLFTDTLPRIIHSNDVRNPFKTKGVSVITDGLMDATLKNSKELGISQNDAISYYEDITGKYVRQKTHEENTKH